MTPDLPKTSWKHERPFRLGELEVLPASGELRGRRGVQRVRPLLMDILLRLAAQPGEVVRRETLLEDVWPRRMVNDEVLSRAIAELRTALGDEARDARYIETLPKIGYRLVAPVAALEGGSEAGAATAASTGAPTRGTPSRGRRGWWIGAAAAAVAAIAGGWLLGELRPPPVHAAIEKRLIAARPLSSDPALELGPRFSPDGGRVAFALGQRGETRIVVQSLRDSARQVIGGPGALRLSPVFFPDGRRIAYWRATETDCGIIEHELESGRERTLVDCAMRPRSRIDLSPDGRWLAFSASTRPQFPAALHVVELGGGPVRALTAPEPGSGDDLFPRFSPDGTQVAFFRGSESHSSAWIVPRDGGPARAASKLEGLTYGAAWIGAQGPLLVAADWLGFRALHVLDPASGGVRLVGGRGARFPDVGPGGAIVFEHATYAANVWHAPLDGSPPRPLWKSTRYTNQPEFSPDGTRVAFSSNRDGIDAIYVATIGGEPRRIAGAADQRYLRPHWSADGRSVLAIRSAVQAAGTPRQEAVRIPADGGAAEILTTLGASVNDARESGDGRWLLWAELQGYAMRLSRAPIGDLSRAERLPWPLVSQYQVNAERVVFTQPQMTRLTSCRLRDLACEPLAVDIDARDVFHWTLGPRSVFAPSRAGDAVSLMRHDLASGRATRLAVPLPSGGGTSLAVPPDESALLVVQEEGPAIDLMLAD